MCDVLLYGLFDEKVTFPQRAVDSDGINCKSFIHLSFMIIYLIYFQFANAKE